jgi:hypothetical protein
MQKIKRGLSGQTESVIFVLELFAAIVQEIA